MTYRSNLACRGALALAALFLAGLFQPAHADAEVRVFAPQVLAQRIEAGSAPVILDVRTYAEYSEGHIPGAIHIPHDELAARLGELPAERDTDIIVYCYSGKRAGIAEKLLLQHGYTRISDLQGHWQQWEKDGRVTQTGVSKESEPGE